MIEFEVLANRRKQDAAGRRATVPLLTRGVYLIVKRQGLPFSTTTDLPARDSQLDL